MQTALLLLKQGSALLEDLRQLGGRGSKVLSCGTCLDYLGLDDDLQAGLRGGMTDIIEAQWRAEKVITL